MLEDPTASCSIFPATEQFQKASKMEQSRLQVNYEIEIEIYQLAGSHNEVIYSIISATIKILYFIWVGYYIGLNLPR